MASRFFLAVSGVSGAISVAVDAAAVHLLAGAPAGLAATAARYGLIHAAALLAIALLSDRDRLWLDIAGWLFVAGLVLFCGSLDLMAAGAPAGFAVTVPWGGSAFILGWAAIVPAALRARKT